MKTDKYTKVVLTVIAICLVWLCIRSLDPTEPVYAQTQPRAPQEVTIVGVRSPDGFLPVKISERARVPVVITDVTTNDHLLPVRISALANRDSTLPVNIVGYNPQARPVPVSIESIHRGSYAGQTLPWDAVKTASENK